MQIVLDTNVLISGLAYPGSIPGGILAAWDSRALGLVMSRYQLDEIVRVLGYRKILKLLGWDDARIESYVRQLLLRVEIADLSGIVATVPADPNDSPILATLIASAADLLVTGDSDLLALRERYPIMTPAEFARRLAPDQVARPGSDPIA